MKSDWAYKSTAQDNKMNTEDQLWMIHRDRELFLNQKWQSWNSYSSLWRIHVRARPVDVYWAQILIHQCSVNSLQWNYSHFVPMPDKISSLSCQ